MQFKDSAYVLELFDSQSITAEKLPHHEKVLRAICDAYTERTGENVYPMHILAFILDARKAGITAKKTDRERKPKEETFGELQVSYAPGRVKETWYDIAVTHHITLDEIVKIIFVSLVDGKQLPVTRQQVFNLLKEYIPMGFHTDDDSMNMSGQEIALYRQSQERAKHLFPEM